MYSKEQLNDIIKRSLYNLTKDELHISDMASGKIDDLINMIQTKKRSDKNIIQFISGYIYSHGIYIESYDTIESSMVRKAIINRYMHNLNLKYIKDEIYHKYDKRQGKNIMLRWHYKNGVRMDDLVDELKEYGVFIDSYLETEQFFKFLDYLEKYKPVMLSKVFSKDEIDSIVKDSFDYIIYKKPFETKNKKNSFLDENDDINIDDQLFN